MTDHYMNVNVMKEAGYWEAMFGLGLNKKKGATHAANVVAPKLCKMDGGHNKFLEEMLVWLEVRAPRYWWQEADTYRLASKQSESTMHTLIDELLAVDENSVDDIIEYMGANFESSVDSQIDLFHVLHDYSTDKDLVGLKANLPEGFLQTRMWMVSYKTLRNIFQQRKNHRLPHWPDFIHQVMVQIEYPEFLGDILGMTCG